MAELTLKACPTCGSGYVTPVLRSTCTSFKVYGSTIASSEVIGCCCENGHVFMLTKTDLKLKGA